jgi:class 3 adenylate cyclase
LARKNIAEIQRGECVKKQMSILFADIRSFTTLSEQMTPEDTFKFINGYLRRMEPAIINNGGFIDKYIGDAIMALFEGSADGAVKAGVTMLNTLADYNVKRQRSNRQPIEIGIGINTGNLMLGTVGGNSRIDTTVIGDAVNLSARLQELTKVYQTPLLISHNTFACLEEPMKYALRVIAQEQVRGKARRWAFLRSLRPILLPKNRQNWKQSQFLKPPSSTTIPEQWRKLNLFSISVYKKTPAIACPKSICNGALLSFNQKNLAKNGSVS